jgi:ADP-ribose diphosphatase
MDEKEIAWQGKYIKIIKRGTWEYVERCGQNDAAIIIPVCFDDKRRKNLVLIKEWRVPLQKYNVGLPAGLVGDHGNTEEVQTAASRELLEETGYSAGRLRFMCSGPPSSGLSTELLHFYLADRLTKTSDNVGVEGEDITVFVVPLIEVEDWLVEMKNEGFVIDPKVYMALWFATKYECE